MNTKKPATKLYAVLSLLILAMVILVGCGNLEVGAMPEDTSPANISDKPESSEVTESGDSQFNGIEIGIEPTPMPETFTYTSDFYGFKFEYPETWTLKEKDHGVILKKGSNTLRINFRWVDEGFNFGRTGMAAGTPIYSDKIFFLGQLIPQFTVELDQRAKFVIYGDIFLVEIDNLAFGIVLEDTITDYIELDLPVEIITEVKIILESFERIEATGTPGESPPTPEASVRIPVSPEPDWLLYTNTAYDFGFYYPPDMIVVEETNLVKVGRGTVQLLIAFRGVEEDIPLEELEVLTGNIKIDPVEEIDFLAQELRVFLIGYDGRVKAVKFGDVSEQSDGSLVTVIHVRDNSVREISAGSEIDDDLIAEMMAIVKSFGRFKTASLPPDVDVPAPPEDPVVAWYGHITSMPEGSRFDHMVFLSPPSTGQIGLTGATPDIEAEILSLRDAVGTNEFVHIWGTLLACSINNFNNNNCQLVVERIQYGASYSEEEFHDWFGTIKKTTFNGGVSYAFELFSQSPVWYGIEASQDESLQAQLEHFLETNETVELSGKLIVGVPGINRARIEISSIESRSSTGSPRPDIIDGHVYENREYGFSFLYPSYMSVAEESNKVHVNNRSLRLTIAYRRADENIQISDIGEVTGKFHFLNDEYFLGSFVKPVLNINDGYITAAYLGVPGVELGEGTPLRFVISLVNTDGRQLANAQVDEMLQICHNIALASWSD